MSGDDASVRVLYTRPDPLLNGQIVGDWLGATYIATIQDLQARGLVICQELVRWGQAGDLRLVVLDGEPLQVNGKYAATHRVPGDGDFRGNLHAGGTAQSIEPTTSMLAAAEHAAQFLNSNGVSLAGIDLVNDKVIEVNVFSTGGLFDATRLYERDFVSPVVTRMLTS